MNYISQIHNCNIFKDYYNLRKILEQKKQPIFKEGDHNTTPIRNSHYENRNLTLGAALKYAPPLSGRLAERLSLCDGGLGPQGLHLEPPTRDLRQVREGTRRAAILLRRG